MNEDLMMELKNEGVCIHCIEAGKKNLPGWAVSVLKEKWNRCIGRFISLQNAALANAVSRRNYLLLKSLKKIKSTSLVLGHNPGAMYATLEAGLRFNARTGFDMEDYHAGEGHNPHLQQLTKKLMQRILPKLDYVSFAAPLIMEEVKKDFSYSNGNWFTLLNYFPAEEFMLPAIVGTGPLRLAWFSQNVTFGRGLELVLPTIISNPGKLELHLYGKVNQEFKKQYLDGAGNIFLHGTTTQQQLHKELTSYDVGLALDIPTDQNRDLAITNKLLTYLQAGLYVLATNIKSQHAFMASFPEMGTCFDYKKNDFKEILDNVLTNTDSIRHNRRQRFEKFKNNNWENESISLLNKWKAL